MATLKVKTRQLDTSAASMQTLVDFFYPVGSFYVQYPDAEDNDKANALPVSKAPTAMFGGSWTAQFTGNEKGGIFFKTEGDPLSQTDGENNARTTGLQTDMEQGHRHIPLTANRVYTTAKFSTGAINWTSGSYIITGDATTGDPTTDTVNGDPRTGKETRPMNRLIRVWKRTS